MHTHPQMRQIKNTLESQGHEVVMPECSTRKQEQEIKSGCYRDTAELKVKYNYIQGHFDAVKSGDCILVVNGKLNKKNYIGANTFLEIGVAYFLGKPIYIFNKRPSRQRYLLDELDAMNPAYLNGKLIIS